MRGFLPGHCGFLAAISLLLTGCGHSRENAVADESRVLYEESVRLTRLYTDSIRAARDSAAVNRLDEDYEKRLTDINMRHPVDTDLAVSEGENDTLIRMNVRYVFLRDSLLEAFSHNAHLAVDTVEAKTEAVGPGGD